ncbi:Probable two-component system sensor histidine kinase PorY [Flavobacterium indicum GPTSA100-9 = DSM 17447]|uniref:histidine kinase n=1 Tax=Flavobacterium indicum (strain DSM 17447 / CIP 109464 / GPTSA100-9) TaxID=1094466 RepID=H8XQB6_FLAIG|nr:HAMP domain-containing sensor histidine kinase [Flavobacterium indicum]CCG52410.1 Probable two-component system sensor histidine kinase PorY [Flavobacterium indicum GPTSA100-9 = DSM 17447]
MQFSDKRNLTRWVIIISSFLIASLILWNTYIFFQIFKDEERNKMELWATAQKSIMNANENTDIDLPLFILSNNQSIPLILTDKNGAILNQANIEENIVKDSLKLKEFLLKIKNQNAPIRVQLSDKEYQLLYYGDSPMLNQLKYYPVALLLVAFLFGGVVYNFYRATKMATQNKLWAGMAKETAHQIGTPLSSLIGWLELLKMEAIDPTTIEEIEKDITRLQTITDRFSKIGSEPLLEVKDIVDETKRSFEYLQSRSSKQVKFDFKAPEKNILVNINPTLHSWTIENLVKNAIDAMKGKGELSIEIVEGEKLVYITIIDTGSGIPKNKFKKIFEPGYTSKKRGWGLGLSLTKRIVNDYHKGKIRVVHSEIGKGTTMQMSFKKATV